MNSIYLANEAMGTKIWNQNLKCNKYSGNLIFFGKIMKMRSLHWIWLLLFAFILTAIQIIWNGRREVTWSCFKCLFTSIRNIFYFIMMIIRFFVLIWVLKGAIQQQQMKFEVIKFPKKHAVLKKSRRKQKCNGRNSVT